MAVHEKRAAHFCGRPFLLALMLLAGPLLPATAQTQSSRAAQIQDHLQKAFEYLRTNDASSAIKEFDAVLELDPKNADANANLGVIAFFQRDYQGAAEYLRRALAVEPSLAKTQALLGICERRLGDPSAQSLLEKSFPRLKDKKLKIQAGIELAGIYSQQGSLDRAGAVMRSLVDLDPDNIEILYTAQRIYSELADDTLNKLAVIAPGSARMQQVIAERLINDGDLKGAIEHYRKALEIDPRLPGVHYELGEAILQTSQTDPATQAAAEKEFQAAAALEGDTAQLECQLGRIAFLQSDMDRAYAHYKRAFEMDPNEVDAQLGMGQLLSVMGKPEEAVKYLRMAIQNDPLNAEAHYRLATNCRKLGLTAEAEKELKLFQEIKKAKDQVRELYRQMNRAPQEQDEQLPDDKP
ncbi:MAG: tetratricopeptide repeat protein [Candidatus Acidiferrum sp.]